MLFVIGGVTFAILGVLAYFIIKMPDSPLKKKKKEKKGPPPEPPKDWQGIAERLEKKVHALDLKLKEAEAVLRDKDKEITEHKAAIAGIEREFKQEQVWRKKEEGEVEKEKKHERLLEEELAKARSGLNSESTQRIKLEYEVKELRTLKETAIADSRRTSSQNMELERKVKSLADENRDFKRQNAELKVKKEADQWVAKDDFIRVEKLLKRARWEVELFKKKFAEDLWPRELQSRRASGASTSQDEAQADIQAEKSVAAASAATPAPAPESAVPPESNKEVAPGSNQNTQP